MFGWAVSEDRVPVDPTLGVKRTHAKTTGYATWSEAQIERFEATHPIGSKERLAFGLLLYAGQRRGDVIRMGPRHLHRGILTIDQGKTKGQDESHLEIPIHPKLAEIIAATPSGALCFLVTHLAAPCTAAGFDNWFRVRPGTLSRIA
jgi:integrase